MTEPVDIVELTPQPVLAIRERRRAEELSAFFAGSLAELAECAAEHGMRPAGPPFAVYHTFGPEVDVEACLPVVRGEAPCGGRVTVREEPAMRVARTIHHGPYDTIGDAYERVSAWVTAHGRPTGAPRERYVVGPGETSDPAAWRTEVEQPFEPAIAYATA